MLALYGSYDEGGYSPANNLTFTYIRSVSTYIGLNGTAFIAVAEENCIRFLFSNSTVEMWNSTDHAFQRIGMCDGVMNLLL